MKKYDSYKDSGVEWIGEIPSHWESWKISHAFNRIGSGTTPESGNPIYHENGTINWLNTGDLNDGVLDSCSKKITTKALDDYSSLKLFPTGSLVMAMYGATIGKTAILNFETTTNQACCVFCDSSIIDLKFLQYWFIGNKEQIINLAIGGGQPNISQNILKDIRVWCPDYSEQGSLTNFLDHKTTQIDQLIAKKEQFIQLLEEERVAVINQAVTKGLDPNVSMKDSGIEWLGDIPEHWEVKQVRYLLEEGKEGIKIGPFGSSLKLDFMTDKGYKVYGQENVIKNDFNKGTKYIDESKYKEMVNYTISSGDIVITMMGTAGLAKVVPNDFEPGIMDSHLTRIRVNKSKFSNRLFELLINDSYLIKSQVKFHSKGSIMGGLNSSIIKSFILPTPDIDEQVKILAFIEKSILHNQEIMNKTQQEIELLKEYKTALISEVVTGKVDVRDYSKN
jgi:type I restriction enzyme, S subunit